MAAHDLVMSAAGAAGAPVTYVEDVFNTYVYTGTGGTKYIYNGIALGSGPTEGTVLHLTGDSLADSAPIPNTISVYGNTSVSTSIKKYGTGSIYFDGSGDYLQMAPVSSLDLGADNFTIESWIYVAGTNSNVSAAIVSKYSSSNTDWMLRLTRTGATYDAIQLDAAGGGWSGAYAFSNNTWYHVAAVRNGTSLRFYVNGTDIGGGTVSFSIPVNAEPVRVGTIAYAGYEYYWNGYIDDLRITKGYARYIANFTPPLAALPLDMAAVGAGGLVWIKQRTEAGGSPRSHYLFDTVRDVTKDINTNETAAQTTTALSVTAFNGNGFTLGSSAATNSSVENYVSWTFRKQPKFFDVVTYTGTGTAQNIAHSLGSVPGCIVIKCTSNASTNWVVYHRSANATPQNYVVYLNATNAATSNSAAWNNTAPTSTVFTVGNYSAGLNSNNTAGYTYVAYVFAHNAGGFGLTGADNVITCGSYVGTGNAGNNITLGYEPQWLMTKASSSTGSWTIVDNMRSFPNGGTDKSLLANNVASEGSTTAFGPTPTGFVSNSGNENAVGVTYIYVAIRRGPMKVPTDATKVFAISGTDSGAASNFPVDFFIDNKLVGNTNNSPVGARLTSNYALKTTKTDAAQAGGFASTWDQSNTTFSPGWFTTGVALYGFGRAPSFMDVVCYAGTGSVKTVAHNLGVAPQLMIVKSSVGAYGWTVYSAATGNGNIMTLQNADPAYAVAGAWNNTSPTASVFTVGTYAHTNNSGSSYNAYLFATCPGVSKVGSFTNTGATLNVDCGFTGGARFLLFKKTSGAADWYVYDTFRGINAGSDPYLSFSLISAQATVSDDVDAYAGGFTFNGASWGTGDYIYLAIA